MARKPLTEKFTIIHKECCGFEDHRIYVENKSSRITLSFKSPDMYNQLNKGEVIEITIKK